MIKIENVDVWGFEHAVRGMRNPYNSWEKSDSEYEPANFCDSDFILGDADLGLMRKLYNAGPEHRKFLRQIFASMDVTCNHVWWFNFDTYKVGVVKNSCSKMHTIHVKEFTVNDFSHEGIDEVGGAILEHFNETIINLELLRNLFNATHEKKYWRAIIEMLPMGYNIRATITMNYENVVSIIHQRKNHKLDEWRTFCDVLADLPYVKEIMEVGSDGR